MESVIDYTVDRIYCEAEISGDPANGITQGIVKLETLLNNPEYDLSRDNDKNGNNILHLIAQCGLYEFYAKVKNHKDFDKIKNAQNDKNMTPYDIALARPKMFGGLFSMMTQDPMALIPNLVTAPYYKISEPKLLDAMTEDKLVCTRSKKENTKLFFTRIFESGSILGASFNNFVDDIFVEEEVAETKQEVVETKQEVVETKQEVVVKPKVKQVIIQWKRVAYFTATVCTAIYLSKIFL